MSYPQHRRDSWNNNISNQLQQYITVFSGVGSNHALRGPQIQVVGVALIIEFCDHNNYTISKSRILVIW